MTMCCQITRISTWPARWSLLSFYGDFTKKEKELRAAGVRYLFGAYVDIHGVPKRFGSRIVVPMFHPAAALYSPNKRPVLHDDFSRLPGFITDANGEDNNGTQAVFEQLDLL